jgi:hypothetical protein
MVKENTNKKEKTMEATIKEFLRMLEWVIEAKFQSDKFKRTRGK